MRAGNHNSWTIGLRRALASLLVLPALVAAAEPAPQLSWHALPALPDRLGVAGALSGATPEGLLVGGGANFPHGPPWEGGKKTWYDTVLLLRKPRDEWQTIGKLPRPLAYAVSITTPTGIICAGGCDAAQHYADVFRLSYADEKLSVESLPELPIPLAFVAGALVEHTVYLVGGAEKPGEQAASKRVFMLDLAAQPLAWREGPALPGKPRILPQAAAYEGNFYVFGGVALEPNTEGKIARVYLRDAWRLRGARGWEPLADLPRPLAAGPTPAPEIEGQIYLLGGDDGAHAGFTPVAEHPGFSKAILAYDARRNAWRTAGEVPAPRATVPCVEWHGTFILPSGEVRPGVRSPAVWQMNPKGT